MRSALARLDRRGLVEIAAAVWELFSAALFASAVVPEASATPWPPLLLSITLLVSAALGPRLAASGARGYGVAAVLRAVAWPLSTLPLVAGSGVRVLGAA